MTYWGYPPEIESIFVIYLTTSERILLIPPAAEMTIIVALIGHFPILFSQETEEAKLPLARKGW